MSRLILPNRAIVQPNQVTAIDYAHPLAKNLIGAFSADTLREGVSNTPLGLLNTLPETRSQSYGKSWLPTAGGFSLPSSFATTFSPSTLTVILLLQRTGTVSQYARILDMGANPAKTGGYDISFGTSNDLGVTSWAGGAARFVSSVTVPLGVPSVIAFTSSVPSTEIIETYLNGVYSTTSGFISARSAVDTTYPVSIGAVRTGTGSNPTNCEIGGILIFNKVLSGNELGELGTVSGFWSIFRPNVKKYWLSMGAAQLVSSSTAVTTSVSNITTQITPVATLTSVCTISATVSSPSFFGTSVSAISTVTADLRSVILLATSSTAICTVTSSFLVSSQLAATLICNASFSSISFFIGSTNNITPATAFPPIPHIFESDMSGVVWQRWLQGLSHKVRDTGQLDWTQLSFKGSNLTDLETRRHNDLQQIQGGASGDFYHLTLQQHDKVDVDEILLWLSF